MRTTVNLPDELRRRAKSKAAEQGRTLTDMIVQGLTIVLDEKPAAAGGSARGSAGFLGFSRKRSLVDVT